MKILLVTEKFSPDDSQRDGGSRLVDTLVYGFKDYLRIMQFGGSASPAADWCFDYPEELSNRFERRLANAGFIAKKVKGVERQFTHIVFIHLSMQFGFVDIKLRDGIKTWTFPMFLTPSYRAAGELVPSKYTEMEFLALDNTQNLLTPSYLEKRQLIEFYAVPKQKIHVVPRGVNTSILKPKIRSLHKPPLFCSLGSVKPQKNTLGLLDLFSKIKTRLPEAKLHIIGPIQNQEYYIKVRNKIKNLKLACSVKLTGYVPSAKFALALKHHHIHLSLSNYETFGRSIFETLASGIPNVALIKNNAAAQFLSGLPYAKFVNGHSEALQAVEEVLNNLPKLSKMALEIGELYNEKILGKLLTAKICHKEALAVTDFDGTLFHKNDPTRTRDSISNFQQFPVKIICSARSLHDLLYETKHHGLKVDWIIAHSGAVISNGEGKILSINTLKANSIRKLKSLVPEAKKIIVERKVVQMSMSTNSLPDIFDLHVESYQGVAFISDWQSSKLRAILKVLRHIKWSGTVTAFGDSRYDQEFLNYFDGELINATNKIPKKILLT